MFDMLCLNFDTVGFDLCRMYITVLPTKFIFHEGEIPFPMSWIPINFTTQIDLTDFAGIGGLHLRSVGSPVADMVHKERGTLNMVDDVPIIPAKADSPVIQPRISISSVADKIHAQIPDFGFYTVGLWGYCQGKSGSSAFVKCSTPSRSLSVDLQSVFHSVSDMLPNAVQSALGMVKSCSLAAVIAYLLGGASTVLVSLLNVIWMVSERRNKGHSTKARRRLGASILLFSMVRYRNTISVFLSANNKTHRWHVFLQPLLQVWRPPCMPTFPIR